MVSANEKALAAKLALDTVMREDRGRLISALLTRVKDFQLAEDALQDALASAFIHWGRNGPPRSPQGWLLQVAWRKALDRIRRTRTSSRTAQVLRDLSGDAFAEEPEEIPDDRLRLIFTCCHPALELKSRVALTLRTICGLTTREVAAAFLDQESAMGQRLSRAKAKIAAAGIPYSVPAAQDWEPRMQGVLAVLYLIFNAGYSTRDASERDLSSEAIFLARLVSYLRPHQPEVEGCLALMLLHHAKRGARVGDDGAMIPISEQNRAHWDRATMSEGLSLVEQALGRRAPGPYQIKAAIIACHMEGDQSDWPQIVALYGALMNFEATPVVSLNRAVAIAETGQWEQGLRQVEALSSSLANYQPFHAARAHLLRRVGQFDAARQAYELAIGMAGNESDALFLRRKRDSLRSGT